MREEDISQSRRQSITKIRQEIPRKAQGTRKAETGLVFCVDWIRLVVTAFCYEREKPSITKGVLQILLLLGG
jgi:hypothetical protein